jgi:hypothetical protein
MFLGLIAVFGACWSRLQALQLLSNTASRQVQTKNAL